MKLRYQMRGLGIGIIVTALLMGVATDNKIPLSDAEIKMRALELGMIESDSLKLSDIPKVTIGSSGESEPSSTEADGASAEGSGGASEPGEEGADGAGSEGDASAPDSAGDSGGENNAGGTSGGQGNPGEEGSASGGQGNLGEEDSASGGQGNPGNESSASGGEGDSGEESGSSEGDASGENARSESGDSVSVIIQGGATSYSVCQELERLELVEDAARFDDYLCEMGYSRSIKAGTFQIPPGTSEEEIARIITGK